MFCYTVGTRVPCLYAMGNDKSLYNMISAGVGKSSRGAQLNVLKTVFQLHNYLTQTREGLCLIKNIKGVSSRYASPPTV